MNTALIVLVLLSVAIVLLGTKLAVVFGLVVACATFSFPLGLIALVAAGVALLFLLAPQHEVE
ncbi:hypothetical protein [Acidisphaera sp. L21]|uniref:hypothetical protein n=1 Tax=Acidisphaera sp. L21 TaxID=1641851 RepID=UPI00131CE4F4|nr:hypothetical protein [Acidisphaera sp. L21]